MNKYSLAFICLLILMLIVGPIVTVNAMAAENDSTEFLDSGSDIESDIGNDIGSNIGREIEQYVDDHYDTTAGMSVAVFNESETIYRNCFGYMDIRNRIPVTEDTVMEWGSVSKLLVWISVMQLEEQGLIDLEADIDTYLPEGFLHNRTYEAPVTMLNLMNHDAGFEEIVIGMATGKELH